MLITSQVQIVEFVVNFFQVLSILETFSIMGGILNVPHSQVISPNQVVEVINKGKVLPITFTIPRIVTSEAELAQFGFSLTFERFFESSKFNYYLV
jgi:hypothetical protein